MFRPIPRQSGPVTLVGGGEATPQMLTSVLRFAPVCVAADGGARLALEAGIIPDAVIGDLDSLSAADQDAIPQDRLHRQSDQDSTDFEKCLAAIQAPVILGVGFLGKRMDHTLAAYSALLKDPRPVILISESELCFVAPRDIKMDLALDTPIGFFPLIECQMTSTGVRYPLTDATVAPDGLISTSNHVTAEVSLQTSKHGVLVILPRRCLEAVLPALLPDVVPATQ